MAGTGLNWKYTQNNKKLLHWATKFLAAPLAKASFLVLFSSSYSFHNSPARKHINFRSGLMNFNNPGYMYISLMPNPSVTSLNWSLCSLPNFQWLRAYRIRFSTPGMRTTFILTSHSADTKSNSLKHPNRNELYALSVFSTTTEVSSWHLSTIHIPRHFFPQTFAATTTVGSSNALILRFSFLISSVNSAWKYSLWVSNQAPQPLNQ